MPELFIELRSEEIPARMQKRAAGDLCRMITDGLTAAGLAFGDTEMLATPRRIALSVAGLGKTTPDINEERKGPRTDAPEKAIQGFLKSAGVTLKDCEVVESKKGSFYLAHIAKPGRETPEVIAELVPDVINKFPWPKSMRWGDGSLRWVRPLQSIITTFGGKVVPFEVGPLNSGNKTVGHRFMSKGDVRVKGLKDYKYNLHLANVVVDPRDSNHLITGGRLRGCVSGSSYTGGLCSSDDGGLNWTNRLSNEIYEIAQDPSVLDTFWAATGNGIY